MKNYELYCHYAMEFGLTFLPKGFNDESWQAAAELMQQALAGKVPAVTHELIDAYVAASRIQNQPASLVAA